MAMLTVVGIGACATSDDDPSTSDHQSAVSQLIGEKFDGLATGNIMATMAGPATAPSPTVRCRTST
jgi:hypothetical protein